MKKKVLIISYSYPPSNVPAAQRPYAVAKYLNKNEFDVTVITCSNADVSWGVTKDFNTEIRSVDLIKIPSYLGRRASALRQSKGDKKNGLKNKLKSKLFGLLSSMVVPDQAIFWYPKVCQYLNNNPKLITDTDVVFTSSPSFSNNLLGRFIKLKNKKVLWVAELRDFHFIETTKKVSNLKQLINKKLENSVMRKADKVSFISFAMKDIYGEFYKDYSHKFHVVYNGFDISDFENLPADKINSEKLSIFYAGSFYQGVRSPKPLLEILDVLLDNNVIDESEIEINIAGVLDLGLLDDLKTYKSYACINLLGSMPRTEVLQKAVSSHLLWLIVGPKATHYTGVPIKFFEYLGARRPILNFAPSVSEPTRIIKENKLGWNFDTDSFDLERSVQIFERVIKLYRSGELSEILEKQFLPQFDRKHQGVLYGELFNWNEA